VSASGEPRPLPAGSANATPCTVSCALNTPFGWPLRTASASCASSVRGTCAAKRQTSVTHSGTIMQLQHSLQLVGRQGPQRLAISPRKNPQAV
jgi:hypothetical protein